MKPEKSNPGNITELSWNDVDRNCQLLFNKIKETDIHFDTIVSIQRGGNIPAIKLGELMRINDHQSIGIRTTASEDIKAKRLKNPIVKINSKLGNIRNKKILLVDDVVNTGKTLEIALKEILKYKPAVYKTAALVLDKNNNGSTPNIDFYACQTPDWVVFPWEKDNQHNKHPQKNR